MPALGTVLAGATLLAGLCPGVCRAQGEPRPVGLCVLPAQGTDFSASRPLARRLLRVFVADEQAQLQDLFGLVYDLSRPPRPDYLKALQRGLQRLSKGNHGAARSQLGRALGTMRRALSAVPPAELAFVQLHLAAAELGSRRLAAARATLTGLFSWHPGAPPALSCPPPRGWGEALRQARLAAGEAPTTTLRVTSSPPGAEVAVDGRRLGITPVVARELPLGLHYFTVTREGFRRQVLELRLTSFKRALPVRLQPDPDGAGVVRRLLALRPKLGASRLEGLAELGQRLGLERVLFIAARPVGGGEQRLHGFLYQLRTGRLLGRAAPLRASVTSPRHGFEPLALWRGAASASRSAPGPTYVDPGDGATASAPGVGVFVDPNPPQQRPWYKRWYVWALVGGAVAAAVILPATLIPSSEPASGSDERFKISW